MNNIPKHAKCAEVQLKNKYCKLIVPKSPALQISYNHKGLFYFLSVAYGYYDPNWSEGQVPISI